MLLFGGDLSIPVQDQLTELDGLLENWMAYCEKPAEEDRALLLTCSPETSPRRG